MMASKGTAIGMGNASRNLTEDEARSVVRELFALHNVDSQRILVLIPDSTRSAPVPLLFRLLHEELSSRVKALDFLVALGTHQPMSDEALRHRVGITEEEQATVYSHIQLFNHRWDLDGTLVEIGRIPAAEVSELTSGMMKEEVRVTLNRKIFDYDVLLVCGPTFPHEVVGFSGGNKYFFPGISGPEVINFTHWVGALITSYEVIGTPYTPVRALIDRAAQCIDRPRLCLSMVVKGEGLAGLFGGTPEEAYAAAMSLSSQVHIHWLERPVRRVLSVMPEMYDDIWTAAKGMYKLEPVIADGGEVIIYAPHIDEFSYTHGEIIEEIGYHVRDYFTKQWDRFGSYPRGVLAHSTHLRGIGTYEDGIERPRISVTLATRISQARCEQANLGYLDPDSIQPEEWKNREDEGILLVPKAGEILYLLKGSRD